ncbi:uncharacterized protein LOC114521097 isoform X2 [Dendronephthya gigantea]|uniref:uncharacterized protein LOC114521097 isoform X2 n=1 Tax=Dendronephthya gigantea TaxID=151771 RepID=UPI00106B8A2A|nr:uncharacterized protein LOC114521097 isoform X2 [Dendronephthya gigantea]
MASSPSPKPKDLPNLTFGAKSSKYFPWITRSGQKLHVSTPKQLQRSMSDSYKFLNFMTILGPARQGKSFLMNCLIGDSVFPSADTMGVCTKGIQVSNVGYEVGNAGFAFIVDTEGQGDEGIESDATLLTPIILLSKVILFNWKGGLQKNQILNELALLVEVANCVSSNSFEEDKSKFGHLHIVLRDFHFEGTVEEAFAMIFDNENKRGEQVKERNKIREKLLSSFESIDVCILPTPREDVRELDLHSTSEEFKQGIEELKYILLAQMDMPRSFGTVDVNFNNVNAFVKSFAEKLEDGDIVHVKSVVSQLQRGTVDEAKRFFEESLIEAYKKIDVPVKNGLENVLVKERDALLDAFKKITAQVDLEDVYRNDVLERLEDFADREIDAKRKENQLATQSRKAAQSAILATAEKTFRSMVENELSKAEEGAMQIEQRFPKYLQGLGDSFLEKTGGLDWIQNRSEKFEDLKTWAFKRMKEKVEAKKNAERSEQQVCLAKAAEDFRSEVENELRRDQGASGLRETFRKKKANLVSIFQNSTNDLHLISKLQETELKKLNSWAEKKFEEKVQAVEKEKHERMKLERQLQAMQQQSSYDSQGSSPYTSYSTPQASSSPYSSQTPPSNSSLKFYAGGQFTPGGGRSPRGGCYMSGSSSRSSPSSSRSSASSSRSSASSSRSSSSGGGTFYKGGQFTPGGGRAPKGGCWK